MVTPAARREVAETLAFAAGMVGADRTSVRYRSRRGDDAALRGRLRELARQRRRFGYRRLHILLLRDGELVGGRRLRVLNVMDSSALRLIESVEYIGAAWRA